MHAFRCRHPRRSRWFRTVLLPTLTFLALAGMSTSADSTAVAQRLEPERLTNGARTRDAFRPLTALARQACVQLLEGDDQVALGAIVADDGWVLTKASEVRGSIRCVLADGRNVSGRLVAVDSPHDLALVKIAAENLQTIRWKREAEPTVGSWVVSVGLSARPVAVGVVSTPARRIPPQQGILGISIGAGDSGPQITHVFPNSGADHAGLRSGDVLVEIDETPVGSREDLVQVLMKLRAGETVPVRVVRNGRTLQMDVTLGRRTANLFSRGSLQNQMSGLLSDRRDGFSSALQHDTVLDRDECGGPLLDLSGEAIGLNIARAGRTESYALTSAQILPVLERLLAEARTVVAEEHDAAAAPDLPVPPQE